MIHDTVRPTTKERSFDTAETSSSLYSLDLLLNSPASKEDSLDILLNSPASNEDDLNLSGGKQGADAVEEEEDLEEKSSSAGSDNTAAIQNNNGLGCCSKMETVHIPSNIKDLYSSPSLTTNNNGNEYPPADEDDISSSLSLYIQNLMGLKKNSQKAIKKSPWKEDKPFDEESVLESELGEGVEAIYGIGVYTGFNNKTNDKEGGIPPSTLEEEQGTTTDVTCRMASGVADPKESEKSSFRCRLLCLLLVLVAIILALVLGLRRGEGRGSNKQQQELSQVLGSDNGPGGMGPFASPTPMPIHSESPSPSTSPISSSVTEVPIQDSVLPSSQPVPTVIPSPSPTLPPTPPTRFPTNFPLNFPTSSPTPTPSTLPTGTPTTTTPKTLEPTDCQTIISVDRLCYVEKKDSLVVEFNICNPQEGDWVGIYLEEDTTTANGELLLGDDYMSWSYTCGGRRCTDPTQQNQFSFLTVGAPLTSYRAVVISGSDGADPPFTGMSMSESFVIAEDCS